jgi:hypothetical protein
MKGGVGPSNVPYFPKKQSRRHVPPNRPVPQQAQDPITGGYKYPGKEQEYRSKVEQRTIRQISEGRSTQYKREGPINVILMTDKQTGSLHQEVKHTGIKLVGYKGGDEVDKLLHCM